MKTAIITVFCILLPVFGPAVPQSGNNAVFRAGEELVYAVKWNFIPLGRIIIRTNIDSADTNRVMVLMVVESTPGLPFISIRDVNRSVIDRNHSNTLRYTGKHWKGDDTLSIEYVYDQETKTLTFSEWDLTENVSLHREVSNDIPPFVDGNALFFYARWRSSSGKSFRVPTVVDGKLSYTTLTFSGEREAIEVDAIPGPVVVRKYTGRAEWTGGSSAGLSGEFTGWVSDDPAAVPVRAEMQIALGSITIELEQWKRSGWTPPLSLDSRLD